MKLRQHHQINLMPESYRTGLSTQPDAALVGFLFLVILISAGNFLSNYFEIKDMKKELLSVMAENATLGTKVEELKRTLADNALSAEQQKLVKDVMGVKYPWAETFKELSLVVPENTWLTKFSAENKGGAFTVALIGETESQGKMANFFSNLEKSVYFRNLTVVSSELKKSVSPPLYEFIFTSPGMKTEGLTQGGSR